MAWQQLPGTRVVCKKTPLNLLNDRNPVDEALSMAWVLLFQAKAEISAFTLYVTIMGTYNCQMAEGQHKTISSIRYYIN